MTQYKYMVKKYSVFTEREAETMRCELEELFNQGWKPTTNGPVIAAIMDKHIFRASLGAETIEQSTFLFLFVLATETPHDHN